MVDEAALVDSPILPSTQRPHILYFPCISFKECSPTSSSEKCCLHGMAAKDPWVYSHLPNRNPCLYRELFTSSQTFIIWRKPCYMCATLHMVLCPSIICDLKNLSSYFNTKEIRISLSQSLLFIGAYPVCLALLHSDFTHKKLPNATEIWKNFILGSKWFTSHYTRRNV